MDIFTATENAYKNGFLAGEEKNKSGLITAKDAKDRVENTNDIDYFWNSIIASIYNSISMRLFHCVWYTPASYDCRESDINIIVDLVNKLKKLGYSCTISIFEPTDVFCNTRVKLHISWE